MFTNRQTLFICGAMLIVFFFSGLFGVLDYLIIKLILAVLFILIILNLFLIKKETIEEEKDSGSSDSEV